MRTRIFAMLAAVAAVLAMAAPGTALAGSFHAALKSSTHLCQSSGNNACANTSGTSNGDNVWGSTGNARAVDWNGDGNCYTPPGWNNCYKTGWLQFYDQNSKCIQAYITGGGAAAEDLNDCTGVRGTRWARVAATNGYKYVNVYESGNYSAPKLLTSDNVAGDTWFWGPDGCNSCYQRFYFAVF